MVLEIDGQVQHCTVAGRIDASGPSSNAVWLRGDDIDLDGLDLAAGIQTECAPAVKAKI